MTTESKMQRLVKLLNDACQAYYSGREESTLTDAQYDGYLAELKELEYNAGYRLAESPTFKVGYEEDGDKIKHFTPILSLKDTKSVEELLYFLGEEEGVLSWKLDGISIVLYYQNGRLDRAVSRGDGMYGKDITSNVWLMRDIPKTIDILNTVIVRGEGCMAISDFDTLKESPEGERYRNPRNLAAGLINSKGVSPNLISKLHFIAHSVILIDGFGRNMTKKSEQLDYLDQLGFHIVPYKLVVNYTLHREIEMMTNQVEEGFDYPVDGLVLTLDDLSYSEKLGSTSRYPRDTMAFKWPDKSVLTKVRGVKWSVSQTGLITPVVIFDPVELEGTTVKQANLHTLKCFEDLGIGKGDTIEVYKANKIIPEVKENLTRSATEDYPKYCPICGGETTVLSTNKTRKLYCTRCEQKIF